MGPHSSTDSLSSVRYRQQPSSLPAAQPGRSAGSEAHSMAGSAWQCCLAQCRKPMKLRDAPRACGQQPPGSRLDGRQVRIQGTRGNERGGRCRGKITVNRVDTVRRSSWIAKNSSRLRNRRLLCCREWTARDRIRYCAPEGSLPLTLSLPHTYTRT